MRRAKAAFSLNRLGLPRIRAFLLHHARLVAPWIGKPYSLDLRKRLVAAVATDGLSCPWCAQPDIAFVISRQDSRHGLGADCRDDCVRLGRQKAIDEMRTGDRVRLGAAVTLGPGNLPDQNDPVSWPLMARLPGERVRAQRRSAPSVQRSTRAMSGGVACLVGLTTRNKPIEQARFKRTRTRRRKRRRRILGPPFQRSP
jgi:hypothetical protein